MRLAPIALAAFAFGCSTTPQGAGAPPCEGEYPQSGQAPDAVEIPPRVVNPSEVATALAREFPASAKERGIDGTVTVGFEIDAEGRVAEVCLLESSGHRALDEAAYRVAPIYEFSPAFSGAEPVGTRLAIPVTFAVR